jgi:hypothetical protein
MPIDGTLLGLQRRDAPLGEIRIGTSVAIPGKNGRQPKRLETFRFTTSVELNAHAIAAKYGGTVAPWAQRRGRWEVITDRAALEVWVPPAGAAVDTNMEMWDGPKRLRQCDGRTERLSGEPCTCPRPADPYDPASVRKALDERHRLAAMRPPRACKPLTRINVTIPDLPGLVGCWKLSTGSENAAVEIAAAGDAMMLAREGGVYLPAVLSIQWRNRADTGAPYPVPFLQIGVSMRELAAGQLPAGPGGLVAQLRAAAEHRAITADGDQARAITAGAGERVITGKTLPPGSKPPAADDDGQWPQEPEEPADGVLAEDEADWLAADSEAAATFTAKDQARVLWRAVAARAGAGAYGADDAERIQGTITARLADLAAPAGSLADDDPWRLKAEGLGDEHDAANALDELAERTSAGTVDPRRSALIRAAILDRFPRAEAA